MGDSGVLEWKDKRKSVEHNDNNEGVEMRSEMIWYTNTQWWLFVTNEKQVENAKDR